METFDFTDYLVHYDVLYNTDHIFTKDCFKNNDGNTVPIIKVCDGYEYEPSLGMAVLENCDDGIIAKCTFTNHDFGEAAKEVLLNKEYGISVYAHNPKYVKLHYPVTINKVLSADLKAVILVPNEKMPRIKEMCDDECRSTYSE